MRVLGKLISGLGTTCYVVFGVWGLLLSFSIVHEIVGFWGFVIAVVVLPVTFAAAPWYALFHWGTWFPLLVSYGGFILAAILSGIGSSLSGD
jgi:hypothetical protein